MYDSGSNVQATVNFLPDTPVPTRRTGMSNGSKAGFLVESKGRNMGLDTWYDSFLLYWQWCPQWD
jgi:hypothetical protein